MHFPLIRIVGLVYGLMVGGVALGVRAEEVGRPIPLWAGTPPGDEGLVMGEEKDMTSAKDGLIAGRGVIRLGNVTAPTLTVYPAPKEKSTGAAVVVCPGGGYHILAMDLEGTEVVEWLNSIGVTGVLLKYRVPARKDRPRYAAPLQDVQRAMGLVRSRAAEWGIDPKRVGVMGFSAGAHLSAALSTRYEKREYEPIDAADRISVRPDFALLIYPGYLALEKEGDRVASELIVTPNTPSTFILQTQDDGVRVENSVSYYLALKQQKVAAELHLYATGGHGYGLRSTDQAVTGWPRLAERWMRGLGILGAGKKD